MALTPAPTSLLHHARILLLNLEKIAADLAEYTESVRGHVAFAALGRGMELVAIRLEDPWAARELNIVVRDPERLSASGGLMLNLLHQNG